MKFKVGDKVNLKPPNNEIQEYFSPEYLKNNIFTVIEVFINWDETEVAYIVLDKFPSEMYHCESFEKNIKAERTEKINHLNMIKK